MGRNGGCSDKRPEVSNEHIIDLRTGTLATLALALAFGWFSAAGIAQTRGEAVHFDCVLRRHQYRTQRSSRYFSHTLVDPCRAYGAATRRSSRRGRMQLLDTLRDMRSVGRIHTPGNIGYDLRYAEERKLPDGGREIILATDRPMSFWEITNRPRSSQYPFTWVQFKIGPDGKGAGKIVRGRADYRRRSGRPDRSRGLRDFARSPGEHPRAQGRQQLIYPNPQAVARRRRVARRLRAPS